MTACTIPVPLFHRLLQSHPLLVFDAGALADYSSVDPQDTWALACEAFADDVDQLPRLLDLSDLSPSAADKVLTELDQAQTLHAPPLLLGDIAPGADLGRWALTQLTQAPDGSQHWLRWHDARVWANLLWIATPGQLAHLVGPAKSVGWNWRGQWYQTSVSAQPATWPSPEASRWSAEQWQLIQSIGVINRVWARIGQPELGTLDIEGNSLAQVLEALASSGRWIAAADAQAHSMTIWDMPSRVEFARHSLLYGNAFWEAEQFHPLMTEVATREATYDEVVSAQGTSFWASLADTLDALGPKAAE